MHALFERADWSTIKHIAIFRALKLGDMLNVVPALRALRTALPSAHITLVGLPWCGEFVKRFASYLDEFIQLPGIPGFPEQTPNVPEFPNFLREVQSRQFDLTLQMQGSGDIANTVISFWGAKYCAGFYKPGQYCPDKNLFLEYPEAETEVWRHLRLMEFLGIPLQGDELEFPIFEEDWAELYQLKQEFGLQSEYVCIHPGASKPTRRWPVANFANVADGLAALGLQIVLTGTRDESDLTRAMTQQMKAPAIDLAGKTTLGNLAALISKSKLVVSNDTGISHVAAAVKSPSIILFSVSDMDRWAPKNKERHKVLWPAGKMTANDVLRQAKLQLRTAQPQATLSMDTMRGAS